MDYDIAFTRAFRHTPWLDQIDRVTAGGDNGFNARFHALEADLDSLGTRVADVNAALNTGREELYTSVGAVTGDGGADTADGQSGFQVLAMTAQNDFQVLLGPGVVGGRPITMRGAQPYAAQRWTDPAQAAADGVALIPPLSTPTADRTDLVYVDVWEHAVEPGQLRREVAIRVVEGGTGLPPAPAGHSVLPVALLHRRAGVAQLEPGDIEDRCPRIDRSSTTRLLTLVPGLHPFDNLTPWVPEGFAAVARPPGTVAGFMPVTLPQRARLVSLRVLVTHTGVDANGRTAVALGRVPVPGTETDIDFIAVDTLRGEGKFDRTITASQALDVVDNNAFAYWFYAQADLAAGTSALQGFTIRYVS